MKSKNHFFYFSIIFFVVLLIIGILDIIGFKINSVKLLFLAVSSYFFAGVDLVEIAYQVRNVEGIPKFLKSNNRNSKIIFFWLGFIFFIIAFCLTGYFSSTVFFTKMGESLNTTISLFTLALVFLMFGMRTLIDEKEPTTIIIQKLDKELTEEEAQHLEESLEMFRLLKAKRNAEKNK